jgi:hypothetical protein
VAGGKTIEEAGKDLTAEDKKTLIQFVERAKEKQGKEKYKKALDEIEVNKKEQKALKTQKESLLRDKVKTESEQAKKEIQKKINEIDKQRKPEYDIKENLKKPFEQHALGNQVGISKRMEEIVRSDKSRKEKIDAIKKEIWIEGVGFPNGMSTKADGKGITISRDVNGKSVNKIFNYSQILDKLEERFGVKKSNNKEYEQKSTKGTRRVSSGREKTSGDNQVGKQQSGVSSRSADKNSKAQQRDTGTSGDNVRDGSQDGQQLSASDKKLIEDQEFGQENSTKKFQITLDDGRKVNVAYKKGDYSDHFEFRGEATSHTGYRSDFFGKLGRKDSIEKVAKIRAELFSKETDKAKKKQPTEGAGATRKAERGLLDQFFTPQEVVGSVWDLINPYLPSGKLTILEPAAGTGRFIANAPKDAEIDAFEIDKRYIDELKGAHPNVNAKNESFETIFIDERGNKKPFDLKYDLVIGNPPYGKHRGKYKGLGEERSIGKYEEYFVKRSLDLTKEGGIVAMVLPSSFMRSAINSTKTAIALRGDVISAYRLPNKIFNGTDVGTDIVIWRKKSYLSDKTGASPNAQVLDRDTYFEENQQNVLGTTTEKRGRFGMEPFVEGTLEDAVKKIKGFVSDIEIEKQDVIEEIAEKKVAEKEEVVVAEAPLENEVLFVPYGKKKRMRGVLLDPMRGLNFVVVETKTNQKGVTDLSFYEYFTGKAQKETSFGDAVYPTREDAIKDFRKSVENLDIKQAHIKKVLAEIEAAKEKQKGKILYAKQKRTKNDFKGDGQGYFINQKTPKGGNEFKKVIGKKVVVKGLEGMEIFAHKSERKKGWELSEARSGASLTNANEKTIAEAKKYLESFLKTKNYTQETIEGLVDDFIKRNGESPRYKQPTRDEVSKKEEAKEIEKEVKLKTKLTKKQKENRLQEMVKEGLIEQDPDRKYVWKSVKKDDTKQFSQGFEPTETEVLIAQNTAEDGSVDISKVDKSLLNYYKGKYYGDFNYYQGNIYEKLSVLEQEKDKMSQDRYDEQKERLGAILPPKIGINKLTILPISKFARDFKVEGGKSLAFEFSSWLGSLDYNALQGLSARDIQGYIMGEVVNTGEKLRNQELRKKRREVGNRLFKKFYREELSDYTKQKIVDSYNKTYNATYKPDYRKYPIFPELNKTFYKKELKLRDIQMEGSSFLVNKGVGLLAYDVGVGKTLAGITAISEVMRRGWAKRPLIVVPRNLKTKWIEDLVESMPGVKINDLANLGGQFKGNIKDIEVEEGSISIITEEGFKRIGFKENTQNNLLRNLKDKMYSKKELSDREKQQFNEKIEEIGGMAKKGTREELSFEDLGFDHITIDEAHRMKNIFASAEVKEEKGRSANEYKSIRGAVSERGFKAYLATQYILDQNKGRNVFLLTATPFSNNPIEIYSIMSLMAKKRMEDMGIDNVNEFISQFVELENKLAIKANGQVVETDQVRNFHNLQQLQKLIREYIDFRTGEEAGVPRPDKQQRTPFLKLNEKQAEYILAAQELFSPTEGKSAGVLRAIIELQKITLSPYLSTYHEGGVYSVTPKQLVEDSPKIKYVVEGIERAHKANPEAGQIVFVEKGIEVLPIMKDYFVNEKGYDPEEVEILDSSVNEAKKDDIKERFQDGDIRILLATGTVKEGIDLQKKSTDLYNIFLPWNPTDMLQIEGRTWRQGSEFKNVRIHYPLVENTIDSFMFQKLEEKAERLRNIWTQDGNRVDVSDINFEEMKLDLITDPVKRVEAKKSFQQASLRNKEELLKSELEFINRKLNKQNKLWYKST